MIDGKDLQESGHVLLYLSPQHLYEETEEHHENCVRVVAAAAQIPTKHLPNSSLKRQH
jgi:hypothetical protein